MSDDADHLAADIMRSVRRLRSRVEAEAIKGVVKRDIDLRCVPAGMKNAVSPESVNQQGEMMDMTGAIRAGSAGAVYATTARVADRRQNLPGYLAASADTVSISQTARDLLAAQAATPSQTRQGSTQGASTATFDTNVGSVEINLDEYFSDSPRSASAELPPLMMPTQANIDALNKHLSASFPGFLAEHGIPAAPAKITYDTMGQPQFPADYPYAAQLRQALQDSPGMAREISTAYGLTDSKAALDEAAQFQEAYRQAGDQRALEAVIAKYSALLSGNTLPSQTAIHFTADGQMSITSGDRVMSV